MEVHEAPPLVLRHLRVREPYRVRQRRTGQPRTPSQHPPQLQREAVPQLAGLRLPEHGAGVVVAARTQRLTESRIVCRMTGMAPHRSAMRTALPRLPRTAGQHSAAPLPPRVHGTEARSGEGGEHPRVPAHRLRDCLTADQSGPDELVRVRTVELSASRTDRRPAVAARDQEPTAERFRGIRVKRRPRGNGHVRGGADEVNRVGAAAEAEDAPPPAVEVRPPGALDKRRDCLTGLRHRPPPNACRITAAMASGGVFAEKRRLGSVNQSEAAACAGQTRRSAPSRSARTTCSEPWHFR